MDHFSFKIENKLKEIINQKEIVWPINISGTSSKLLLSKLLTNASLFFSQNPQLVIVPTLKDAYKLYKNILFFNTQAEIYILPHFDVSPYSTLYPSKQNTYQRINWLYKAQNTLFQEIFIAPIESVLQKTIPLDFFLEHIYIFKLNNEIPTNFSYLLESLGYEKSSYVENTGEYAIRGGIIDIFIPNENHPIRIELFGEEINSIRSFNPQTGRSQSILNEFVLIPTKEAVYNEENKEFLLKYFQRMTSNNNIAKQEKEKIYQNILKKIYFNNIDFLLPAFYPNLSSPLDFLPDNTVTWIFDFITIEKYINQKYISLKKEYQEAETHVIRPEIFELYNQKDNLNFLNKFNKQIYFENLNLKNNQSIQIQTLPITSFQQINKKFLSGSSEWLQEIGYILKNWKESYYKVFLIISKKNLSRIKFLLEKINWDYNEAPSNSNGFSLLDENNPTTHINKINLFTKEPFQEINESVLFPYEKIIFIKDEDFLGRKIKFKTSSSLTDYQEEVNRLSFRDLKYGDFVVHIDHGIGIYQGLKQMNITGVDSEFIQIEYKDKDRLYLPIFKINQIQKFSGPQNTILINKLGTQNFNKTKEKVKSHLKDIASELLQIYSLRTQTKREKYSPISNEYNIFENQFPYEETIDQQKSTEQIFQDFEKEFPMDRLICGDVGFGKTEVAMRAIFRTIEQNKQVAFLAPTTILTFQHYETLKKRFTKWSYNIKCLNRFISPKEKKTILKDLKEHKIDIIVGTHRLLSKDVSFKNLGLLIIDEEQKFGVSHKEKIKRFKINVDTLSLSATPIPRTLNMSLVGIRDLSLIRTPPIDRQPTRTFVCKFNSETIRKAILFELERKGQIFFIHNRVQSIHTIAKELKEIVPEAKMTVVHGQMPADELEKNTLSFYQQKVDILICTSIIESGIDIPNANTMFINEAHTFGLSQLYQLRGRVGRSIHRAYCYLLVPKNKTLDENAQERLKVIQENTELGSGIIIAQYDLELRGSGNLLGKEQSGFVNAVGHELYMELLDQTIRELKGEEISSEEIEPDINVKIKALIPNTYISDIKIRLSLYKELVQISSKDNVLEKKEMFEDQFGPVPEEVENLLELMLIRHYLKILKVRDLSSGKQNISLVFTNITPITPDLIIKLTSKKSSKYQITPDNRLIIKIKALNLPDILDEIKYLYLSIP